MSFVCLRCIQDAHLQQSLRAHPEPCEYCDSGGPSLSIYDIAVACDQVIDAHFECTHGDRSVWLHGRGPMGLVLKDTLASLNFVSARAADAVLDKVIDELGDLWWDRDSRETKHVGDGDDDDISVLHFRLRSDLGGALSQAWTGMQHSLQQEARYVVPEAIRVLQKVFGGIHADRTDQGHPIVVDAGPGTFLASLYRARTFQEDDPLSAALGHPARLLGTPAPGIGRAGRMNSAGQPAFYGATSAEVAIAEVRPPVGAWVVTAVFDLIRPVKLLDLRNLGRLHLAAQSFFSPAAIELAQRRDFLRQLVDRLTEPVMPDLEQRDYLITQVIADYLATHEGGPVDGIIYPSVQKPEGSIAVGFNVALFPRAARVDGADGTPVGVANVWEWDEDGPERYLAPELFLTTKAVDDAERWWSPSNAREGRWPATLKVDPTRIEVLQVRGVSISTYGFPLAIRGSWP